jgi:tight adherence protein B
MDPLTPERVIVALFAVFAVLFATFTLLVLWDVVEDLRDRRRLRSRMAAASRGAGRGIGPGTDTLASVRRADPDDGLPAWIRSRLPFLDDLVVLLAQAGLDWSPGMFLLLTTGLAVAGGMIGLLLSGSVGAVLVLALLGAALPWMFARLRRRRRVQRFEREFPQAMDLLARAARAGHPLSAGVGMVADEDLPVVSAEFRRVDDEIRFGLPQSDALLGLADRISLMDVRIFVTAVLIQREAGGNLAEVLDNIAETIRTRFSLRRQLKVHTAQGRLSGLVLGLLPFAVAAALMLIDASYLTTLAEQPVGRAMVGGALTLQVIGFFWIRHIVNLDF